MSWDEKPGTTESAAAASAAKVDAPEVKPEATAAAATTAEPKADATKADSKPADASVADANAAAKPDADGSSTTDADNGPMVPQKLIGKVAQKIREKAKAALADKDAENAALREENRRLKEAGNPPAEPDSFEVEEDKRVTVKVREQFLKLEDARGRKKYGAAYEDALALVKAQNDAALISKIQWADNPTDVLMAEAERIAETIEYGDDPKAREAKKEQEITAKVRKQIEAEFAAKLSARNNQPTDVSNVRAAGGDARPRGNDSDWSTLPK